MEYGGYGVEAKWTNMAAHRSSYMGLDGRSFLSISGLLSADDPVGETLSRNRPLSLTQYDDHIALGGS